MVDCVPEKGVIGKTFRRDAKPLLDWLAQLDEKGAGHLERELQSNGWAVMTCCMICLPLSGTVTDLFLCP